MDLEIELMALKARVEALENRRAETPVEAAGIATDDEMAHQYADPVVKYGLKAKYWPDQPDPFVGRRWSETTPEYMAATAKYLSACAFMARKGGDEKKAGYKELDARRARRHAVNMREAKRYTNGAGASAKHAVTPEREQESGEADLWAAQENHDEIPF